MDKFRKEVDFHHKVAYRFEKAYRLGKKNPHKKQALNLEIIDILTEHSDYIDQDPLALFYCLYFCIYYNNPELVEFLRSLLDKMDTDKKHEKITQLLDFIDTNGLIRLRTIGEVINSHVYHMVYYQAVDDELRVVYSQILRQLRFIQMRDKDALILLKNRDYDLIKLTFDKFTTKINIKLFFKKAFSIKSHKYRRYTQAYYEEILIDNNVESRIAQNYRERFLITPEDIIMVLEMYSKNDYVSHFLKLDLTQISHSQFVTLFKIAVKNDAFKIALQVYLRYLTSFDIDNKIMDIIMETLETTQRYHEMKLFYIHQHFDILTISQMNQLIDTFMEILNRPRHITNPMITQYNCIKYALLIYRISWKIEQKKIYSLITKCTLLNNYINNSLIKYFEKQHHISQLYLLMREPIFHMTERKDSLDVMLEMKMENLLQHPVIVEVLNLVYEGKFSVDSSAMSLSQTFSSFFLMQTQDLKSINERLVQNIISFGDTGSEKQASLQFNIWKQCIEQREQDEMLFTVIVSCFFISVVFYFDYLYSSVVVQMEETFGFNIIGRDNKIDDVTTAQLSSFCPQEMETLLQLSSIISVLNILIIISGVGYLTSVVQKFTILKIKDNVHFSIGYVIVEITLVIVCGFYFILFYQEHQNEAISEACKNHSSFSRTEINSIDFAYGLMSPKDDTLNFKLLVSALVILQTLIMIMMLQRTEKLGEIIIMTEYMTEELGKYFATFGVLIAAFIIIGRQLNSELMVEESSFIVIILNIFDGFNGNQNFDDYTQSGKIFISIFVYLFNVLFLTLLVAMFINRLQIVYKNLAAIRRMDIIKLKNSSSFDPLYGGVTITFFPISIMILPFIIPVIIFKSERLNDFILKIQYGFMMMMYVIIAVIFSILILPLIYGKCIFNAFYIVLNNKREAYKGQNIINMLFTLFLNPFIILISFTIDFINLPSLLLKDDRYFEFKYLQSLEILGEKQTAQVLKTFAKIFYLNFHQDFGGKSMTVLDSMIFHRKAFSLIGNMHDFICRGVQDSKQALANVQDYNLSKILSRKCCIPGKTGDIKEALLDFNTLYAFQMDLELYNYSDIVFRDHRSGRLTRENDKKNDTSGNGLNAGVSFLPVTAAPVGYAFKRNNSDFMNNFFIQIVVRSFTDIEAQIEMEQENKQQRKQHDILNDLKNVQGSWKQMIQTEVNQQLDKIGNDFVDFQKKCSTGNPSGQINPQSNSNQASKAQQYATNEAGTFEIPMHSKSIGATSEINDRGKLDTYDELDKIFDQ